MLNTSFNRRGEPVADTPEQALAVLVETEMDRLAIWDCCVRKKDSVGVRK